MKKKVKVHKKVCFDSSKSATFTVYNSMVVQVVHCRHDCVAYDSATEELKVLKARVAEVESYLTFLRSKDMNNYIKDKNMPQGTALYNDWDNRVWVITKEGAIEI